MKIETCQVKKKSQDDGDIYLLKVLQSDFG